MKSLFVFSTLLMISCAIKPEKEQQLTCKQIYCAEGQECVERRGQQPTCECVSRCYGPKSPVCGTNGIQSKTYDSYCELLKDACEKKDKEMIVKRADTSCEEDDKIQLMKSEKIEKDKQRKKPTVCAMKQRNAIRNSIIKFLRDDLEIKGGHLSYKSLLFAYFDKFDTNKDNALETDEFMKILNEDGALIESVAFETHNNPVIRAMCMGELLAITDEDSDYKLTFDEFYKCFDPNFEPPTKQCSLNGKMYNEGADIDSDCNTCKCTCGSWVCTQEPCEKHDNTARSMFQSSKDIEKMFL